MDLIKCLLISADKLRRIRLKQKLFLAEKVIYKSGEVFTPNLFLCRRQ
jgi:hypothetical protein